MSYVGELTKAMVICASHPKAIFLGQGVAVPGTTMSQTFDKIDPSQLLEFPVAEEMQMGTCIGLALDGFIPICIFPRWNFMLRAADQIVNHLDRLPLYSDGGYWPKVIIRTAVPSVVPFDPGPQHDDNFSDAFELMLRTVEIVQLKEADQIIPAYQEALRGTRSTILVEYTEAYKDERGKASGK